MARSVLVLFEFNDWNKVVSFSIRCYYWKFIVVLGWCTAISLTCAQLSCIVSSLHTYSYSYVCTKYHLFTELFLIHYYSQSMDNSFQRAKAILNPKECLFYCNSHVLIKINKVTAAEIQHLSSSANLRS